MKRQIGEEKVKNLIDNSPGSALFCSQFQNLPEQQNERRIVVSKFTSRVIGLTLASALSMSLFSSSALATNLGSGWTPELKMARNRNGLMIGTLAHQVIQAYAIANMTYADRSGGYYGPIPSLIKTDWVLPLAPSNWKRVDGVPKAGKDTDGKTDIVARYDYRPAAPNICEVYEIKSINQRQSDFDLTDAQLFGYIEGINKDQNIPCVAHVGTTWVPAEYPNFLKIPDKYTFGLGKQGMDMYITTTCNVYATGDMSGCGHIYYKFEWKREKDENLVRASAERSKESYNGLYGWIMENQRKRAVQQVFDLEDPNDLIAKLELGTKHDPFQQWVDIEYHPYDGVGYTQVDPYVEGLKVIQAQIDHVNYAYQFVPWYEKAWNAVTDTLRDGWYFVFGRPSRPPNKCVNPQGEVDLPLCG
jgi:hypothetical protein